MVTFVTSSYTMDKRTSNVRKYIAQRAELLGAIRLPNDMRRYSVENYAHRMRAGLAR